MHKKIVRVAYNGENHAGKDTIRNESDLFSADWTHLVTWNKFVHRRTVYSTWTITLQSMPDTDTRQS